MSLVPTEEVPWYGLGIGRKGPRYHAEVLAANAVVARRVLDRISAEGPLATRDFEPEHGDAMDWFGMPENVVRAVLESYSVTGVLGLARREGNRRYYDLLTRLLPADATSREVPLHERLRHTLLSRYRAHGLLGSSGVAFDRIGPPNSTPDRPGRTELRRQLVEDGVLAPVDVEGVRGNRFVLAEELPLLQNPPQPLPTVAFIAPFDALLWDTAFIKQVFDFTYVWEGFFPPARRRWGRYVLPIIYADRFVGRIEPRIDHARSRVEVLGLWWEDGFAPAECEGFVAAMHEALDAYLRFASATHLHWAPHLTADAVAQ
jgi:uncharacterized protein